MDIFDFDKKQVFTEILEECRERCRARHQFSICGVILYSYDTRERNIIRDYLHKHKPSFGFMLECYDYEHDLTGSEFWWPLNDGLSRIIYLERLLAFIEHGEQTNSIQ